MVPQTQRNNKNKLIPRINVNKIKTNNSASRSSHKRKTGKKRKVFEFYDPEDDHIETTSNQDKQNKAKVSSNTNYKGI